MPARRVSRGETALGEPTVPCAQLSRRPLGPNSFGPLAGAATVPQMSCRSFSSTPVETSSMCQRLAPAGNPGLFTLAAIRSGAATIVISSTASRPPKPVRSAEFPTY